MRTAANRIGFIFVLAALAVGCAAGLAHVLSVVGLHVPFDPNEGWNAYFAELAMRTGSPYPRGGGFLVNNYPPLSFFVIGELGRISGDAIVTGRVVSLLSVGVTALGIARALELMGCTRLEAAFAALLFIGCLILTSDYVGMDDPQLFGHAISIWGAVLFVRASDSPRAAVIAALLFTLAFFVKHNLVLLPLSLAAWLLLINRRLALDFIASTAIFLLIGLGIFRGLFGTSLFHQIASERIYAFENIAIGLQNWLPWAAAPLCATLVLYMIGRRDRHVTFAVMYAAIATIGGLVFSSGAGVDANAMFDADIALVLCAGLLLNRLECNFSKLVVALLYIAPLAFLLQGIGRAWTSGDYWLHPMAQDRLSAASDIALLRTAPEPVLCEMLSLCYWAGKTAQVDVFNMDQRFRLLPQSDGPLVRLIEGKRFSMIELETLKPFPLTGETERALMHNYRIVRLSDDRVFFVPR